MTSYRVQRAPTPTLPRNTRGGGRSGRETLTATLSRLTGRGGRAVVTSTLCGNHRADTARLRGRGGSRVKAIFAAGVFLPALPAGATLYQAISADSASVESNGSISANGTTYLTVYKPTPQQPWVQTPFISTAGGYNGNDALGLEIDPTAPMGSGTPVDKVDVRVSHADDSSALNFADTRYLGFAVKLPSATFAAPTEGRVQIAQWWQGSPYTPPLSITVNNAANGRADYEVLVYNDTTQGNPSAPDIVIGTGEISFNTWDTFVVKTTMNYSGNGEVELWQNGNEMFDWSAASVGYDPTTIPYKDPPQGTPNPNSAFDVFVGPYRDEQETEQQEFFDQMRWASTYSDAVPAPASPALPVPLPAGISISVSSDSDIGGSAGCAMSFSGGTLDVSQGTFNTTRPFTIGAAGGTIDVDSADVLGLRGTPTWSGGTLNVVDAGTVAFSQSGGGISVASGSALNIAAGSSVTVGGSTDPFTDSTHSTQHVALVNNGSLAVNSNAVIAGLTGNGALTVGNGVSINTLQLAPGGGAATVSALTVMGTSSLDLTNNHLLISYGTNADPTTSVRAYLTSGYNSGGWNGTGLVSSAANATQTSGAKYALGYADSADPGNPAGLPTGTIEVKYTLVGDLNLDGAVSGQDFAILAGNFNSLSIARWDAGDLNYDGAISGADFAALAANFGKLDSGASLSLSAADWAAFDAFAGESGLGTAVPEPGKAGVVLVGCAMLAIRRRRDQGRCS